MNCSENALVLSGRNGLYAVETADGTVLSCRSAARIRKDGWKLCAGDRVTVEDNGDGTGFIREIAERKNSLVRPPVANVGLLVLVAAASDPAPDPFVIDKMTVVAEQEKIPLAIAVTKCELGGGEDLERIYRLTPYPVFPLSSGGSVGSEPLLEYMKGRITVFCGASGVGKSTLLNTLFPSLHAEVGDLSARIRRGKNTTRVTSLHRISEGTYVADTPGFTSMDVSRYASIPKESVAGLFPEFRDCLTKCRYTHCTHLCEEGCAVLEAVSDGRISPSRHRSYCAIYLDRKAHPSYENKGRRNT
ncbi:MAG: ribosome small subunit-dependent GTPase A [Clostridia bacterium]|nr:ribosome small subunit-dependent GTPase A [Clostridia bacterium]